MGGSGPPQLVGQRSLPGGLTLEEGGALAGEEGSRLKQRYTQHQGGVTWQCELREL